MRSQSVTTLIALLLVSGCVYYPRQIQAYDPACQIVARKLVLEGSSAGYINFSCTNEACLLPLIPAAASAVISGSIVLVGNVIYWLERQGRCRPTTSAHFPRAGD
ncbi:hypothetical protein [Motiliproteus sp. SC1-56]|uniref:hypothetical protein n=1 Tax=Motiliproteus sp. SC1-56 TaxID=2799565 RepID=UPI001A90B0FE|nr:hypothetical protein [Motiliproteus sp. SC1-56]